MLSEKKLEKLEELLPTLKHKKLKLILKHALLGWEKVGVTRGSYGLCDGVFNHDSEFKSRTHSGCCLMGAALVDRKINRRDSRSILSYNLWIYYGLSVKEQRIIELVFDGYEDVIRNGHYLKTYKDAELLINEVKSIRDILFKDSI